MAEVAQIQLELPIVRNLNQPAQLSDELRLPVRRQSHHLVFIAVMGEANELCDRRIKDSERVREVNTVPYLYPVSSTESKRSAGEITKAIDGQAGCLLKTGNEKG